MGDNISNQSLLAFGPYGTIQLSDGNGLFTGTDRINVNPEFGLLYATQFIGDGGLLSNIQGGGGGGGTGNILTGTPGEVAYYTGAHEISSLSNITVDGITGAINIHSNTMTTNLFLTSLFFDEGFGTSVSDSANLQIICQVGNTFTGGIQVKDIIDNNGSIGVDGQVLKKVGGKLVWG